MRLLAYWPFGIAVIWSGALTISLIHYGAPPAVASLALLGVLLVVSVAAGNARWVAAHRRRQSIAARLWGKGAYKLDERALLASLPPVQVARQDANGARTW